MTFLGRDPDLASPRQRRIGALVVLAAITSPAWMPALASLLLGWRLT